MASSSGPSIPEPLATVLDNFVEMTEIFRDIATTDPISAAMLAVGTVLFLASFGVFGYLAVGALVDVVIPEPSGSPPRHG